MYPGVMILHGRICLMYPGVMILWKDLFDVSRFKDPMEGSV